VREFLVEMYVSRADSAAVGRSAKCARRAAEDLARTGRRVRYVRSIFVPEDETCLHLYAADSAEDVCQAARRAALPFERVLETIGESKGPTTGEVVL
jgi:hypothetical protein